MPFAERAQLLQQIVSHSVRSRALAGLDLGKTSAPVPALTRTSLSQMTAAQLVAMLKSFGLTVVASAATSEGAVASAPPEVTALTDGRAESVVRDNDPTPRRDHEQGWTLV